LGYIININQNSTTELNLKKMLAREYLYRNNIKIYSNSNQILLPPTTLSNISLEPDFPGFTTQTPKMEDIPRRVTNLESYAQLERLGFRIQSFRASDDKRMRKFQKVHYQLVRHYSNARSTADEFPRDTYVQLDIARNQLRLIGPNVWPAGVGNWIDINVKRPIIKKTYTDVYAIMRNADKINRQYEQNLFKTKSQEFIVVKDIPIGISDSQELICYQKTDVEPRIGVWGGTGFAKTWTIHGFVERAYWYWDVRPMIFNDSQTETLSWSEPNKENPPGVVPLLSVLNEEPRPMPTVYVTPTAEGMEEPVAMEDKGIGYKISLPFDEIVLNTYRYFDLKGSEKYFDKIRLQLLSAARQSPQDVLNLFNSVVPQNLKASRDMFAAIITQLYKQNIVDVWSKVPSSWKIYLNNKYLGSYSPMLACAITGIIPVLETEHLQTKGYFPQYFQYFANDIYEKQNKDPLLVKNQLSLWCVVDEIMDISAKGRRTAAAEILSTIQRKGRYRRIGSIIASQFYDKIQDEVKYNCWTVLCFNCKEAEQICNHYGLDSNLKKRIKRLKKFEFMAYTTMGEFVVYDMDGSRRKDKGPFFCTSLAPLSRHSKPMKGIDEQPKSKRKRRAG